MIPTQRLLQRQLKRHFGEGFEVPPEWRGFIAAVDAAYREFEVDQELIERSLELSSKELLEANSELRAIFQAIPDLVFRLDRDGVILSVQAGSGDGLRLHNLEGSRIQESWLRHSGQRFTEALRQVIREKTAVSLEHTRVEDGAECVHEVRLVPLLQDQAVAIARNITERKRAEAMLALSRAKLAQQAQQLELALQKAESASKAKSSFLANMSHELRTPLNAILGYAQLLQRERGIGERQATAAATIRQSGEHLLTLITDILDLSKIEAGKLEPVTGPVHLHAFLQGVADIMRVRADDKSIGFRFELDPELPRFVELDEKRLRQVLLNLLGNAVKFTDRGEVTLWASRVASGTAPAGLRLEVRDTGVGIAANELGAIFKPFEQVGEVQRRSGGTGLGLSISRELVRLMGGDIRVDSTPGQGSRFWFELELAVVQEAAAAPAAERAASGYAGPRRSVLVVDDKAANRALLTDLLERIGFDVRQAHDGSEALACAQRAVPDLVLMDIRMPVMDGLEATRRLRQIPALRTVPVIAVSAGSTGEEAAASLAAGADAFLTNPIALASLLREVGQRLQLEWQYEAVLAPAAPPAADPLVLPPAEDIQALHALAMVGNIGGIRRQADRIAAQDRRFEPFAGQLRRLAQSFQSKAILGLLEQYLQQSPQRQPAIDPDLPVALAGR